MAWAFFKFSGPLWLGPILSTITVRQILEIAVPAEVMADAEAEVFLCLITIPLPVPVAAAGII